MISEKELLRRIEGLSVTELRLCVERGWLRPSAAARGAAYMEIDVARMRLIREMREELEIDDEAIPMLLSLLDGVHSLRRELRALAEAVGELPDEAREQVAAALERRLGAPREED